MRHAAARIFSRKPGRPSTLDPRQQETDPQERVMRQTISGLVAAIAVVTASAAPAMACGGYSPCAQTYVPAPVYSGCNSGCGLAMSGCPIRCSSTLSGAAAPAAVLLRQSGPDLYRSRQLRALSGLSGRRGVRPGGLSLSCGITAAGPTAALLRRSRARAAPLQLIVD